MKNDEWTTPKPLVEYLHKRFKFNVDAAATAKNNCFEEYFSKKRSFLSWGEKELSRFDGASVWCNPPYSMAKEFAEECLKLYVHYGVSSYLLLPVRSDRLWYQQLLHSQHVRDEPFTGRIHFGKAKGSAFMYNIGVVIGFKATPTVEFIDAGQFNVKGRGSATS